MIIDFHTHIFPPKINKDRQSYLDTDPCFALLYANPKAKLITADELVANMDKEGIDISVVLNIGWITHEMCVETNDYILESIARYPKRLVGFCAIQPNSPEAAVGEIERCAKAGLKGVGEMRPDMQVFDFNDERVMAPFAEALNKHHMILLTHASEPIGHYYPGKGTMTPEALYPLLTSYPDLKVVFAHWGGGLPFYALMPEVKKVLANAYFDTAASPFLYNPQVYSQVVQLVGADKVLFGSDYPLLAPSRLISEIQSQGLPEETKSRILSGNARRLLGLR